MVTFRFRLLYFKGWTPSTNPWRMGPSAVWDAVGKRKIGTVSGRSCN